MIMQKIIIASGPVIVKDGKVLLDIQGDDNFWKFCGGKIQENENLSSTAKRRAKEELGIDIEIKNPEAFLLHIKQEKDGEDYDVILAHFLSDFTGEIITGNGVREWDWHSLENLPDNIAPNILPTLKHFGFIK
ncbi:MAG: NUDIX hydrolase [uncultured bacterium]|nr:MAG: NUDIX hydrolase [uncultured bacterium]